MTSLAHLLGMIYDLRDEVERHQMAQQHFQHGESSNLSVHDDEYEIIKKSNVPVPLSAATIKKNDEKFIVSLDLSPFSHNEITVKVRNNFIIVDAKHEEREDEFGFISRQFTRKYILPDDYNTDTIKSFLTDDSKLTIKADMKMKKADIGGDRFIPIQQHASTEDELS
jgi:HSP20 family molecular chaperone IbpA